uniref:Smr domain-containing protein n=1 Tax=Alexandrium catenella TaxID=2925 RepID=A0A7S1RRQ8_ALECA|mmetsp:Transcript_69520/g.184779  ORF Transcript_69520/g.184779 Transcript_69520/m.184779 type:complete len:234 (+) Transcript_69520:1-702(+)
MPGVKALPDGASWSEAVGAACKKSSVSWGSAMSACRDASDWQAALALLGGMPALKDSRGATFYSQAMEACAQSSHWQCALELFASAPETCFRSKEGGRILYNGVLDAALERRGSIDYFREALDRGVYPKLADLRSSTIDLHQMGVAAAVMAAYWWLQVQARAQAAGDGASARRLTIVTGWGRSRRRSDGRVGTLQTAVRQLLDELGLHEKKTRNPGVVCVSRKGLETLIKAVE